jgi:hypothetical protein
MPSPNFRVMAPSALVVVLFGGGVSAQSQPPAGNPQERLGKVCDMMQRVITVRVVDRATGEPVSGATIRATRLLSKERLAAPTAMGTPGDYYLVEDGVLKGLSTKGEPLQIVVSKGKRRTTVTRTIGLDAGGCHIEMRGGSPTITL